MQNAAFFNRALTSTEATNLWTKHQIVDRSNAAPFLYLNDGGSTDIGDFGALAYVIHKHRMGQINLLGCMVDAGDDITAPATRAVLDYYGLTGIPVGAYKGSDIHVGGTTGTPARIVRDAFRPGDTRSNAIYNDPVTFYNALLPGQANGSVTTSAGGFLKSVADYLNSSNANKAVWNSKIKLFEITAGQFPNSSTGATPPGNFPASGPGDWNIGGSETGGPNGPVEALAAVNIISLSTVPHVWGGDEICGNVNGAASLIESGLPTDWTNSNPLHLGFPTVRTAWDVLGTALAYQTAKYGVSNQLFSQVAINAPVIDTAQATAGQNTSTAGSSNNVYTTPKTGAFSITQWRALMASIFDAQVPAVS